MYEYRCTVLKVIDGDTVVTYSPTVEQIADKFTEATSNIQIVK